MAGFNRAKGSYQSFGHANHVRFSDLAKRAFAYSGPARNPVILIHGLLGAKLFDIEHNKYVWGEFTTHDIKPDILQNLALPMAVGKPLNELTTPFVKPSAILDRAGVKFFGIEFSVSSYDTALKALHEAGYSAETVEEKESSIPQSVFTFFYDWRRDICENACLLGKFIAEKRTEVQVAYKKLYGVDSYDVQFDIIAHSMGGLVARYFLMYGAVMPPENCDELPKLDWAGCKYVDKLLLAGTPNDGYLDTLIEMNNGLELVPGGAKYPGAVLATFPAYYEMLPGINAGRIAFSDQMDEALSLFEPDLWIANNWGIANPKNDDLLQLLLPDAKVAEQRREIALDHLRKSLHRAKQLRRALACEAGGVVKTELLLYAGDAFPTSFSAVINRKNGRVKVTEYTSGDGKVPIASARYDRKDQLQMLAISESPIPWRAITHLPAAHMGLLSSPEFWSNGRYELLMRPSESRRKRLEIFTGRSSEKLL